MRLDRIRRYLRALTREQGIRIALTLLAVLSLGIAAATLASPDGGDIEIRGGGQNEARATNETPLSFLFFDIAEPDRGRQPAPETEVNDTAGTDSRGGGGATVALGPVVSAVLVVGLALLVVAAAVAIVRATGGETGEITTDADETSTDAAVGRAAGRMADRLSQSASANDIYRAWAEMTDHLDVETPRTRTSGEFATAAVDAGLPSEDVATLTALFERVRYGGRSVTDERKERAIAALRRVERAHTDANVDESEGADEDEDTNSDGDMDETVTDGDNT